MSDLPFRLRPGLTSDVPLITSSWCQSFRPASKVPYDLFNLFQNPLVKSILERSLTVVAASSDDPNLIMGWICFENAPMPVVKVVHYVYVKAIYRNCGIAKALFQACVSGPFLYTHKTEIVKKLPAKGDYCPYLAYKEMRDAAKE